MSIFTLQRRKPDIDGTFGQLFMDGRQIAVTCEPAVPFPAGVYSCIPHSGDKFKDVWEITHIPGHTDILIHNGNTIKDTKLCVLVGNTYGKVDGLPAVMNSLETLDKLREILPEYFTLQVIDEIPTSGQSGGGV